MAFESNQGLAVDGVPGKQVWTALLKAVAANQQNPDGYTYALASEGNPEKLTVWHDGRVIMKSLANTGIAAAPTTLGTAAVYLKYYYQVMKGTNPDGSKYADPVYYVSYFRAGEAVHYFPRGSYGYPQSLGCVELPVEQRQVHLEVPDLRHAGHRRPRQPDPVTQPEPADEAGGAPSPGERRRRGAPSPGERRAAAPGKRRPPDRAGVRRPAPIASGSRADAARDPTAT